MNTNTVFLEFKISNSPIFTDPAGGASVQERVTQLLQQVYYEGMGMHMVYGMRYIVFTVSM